MIWEVPVRVVEHGRAALVEAETPEEAVAKAKRGDWIEATDPSSCGVTVTGKPREHRRPLRTDNL